jgi:hypothetical protein
MRNALKHSVPLVILLCLASVVTAQTAPGDKCVEQPGFYEQANYTVHDIRIDSPLGWLFGSVDQKLKDITTDPDMPIKKGNLFRKADSDAGFLRVKEKFPELTVNNVARVAVRIAKPNLEKCDARAKTLDVVYHIYSIGVPYYLSRAFETGHKEEVKRSVVDTLATKILANYFPQPFVGYDRSRNPYVGTKLTINQPRGPLDTISLSGSGSSRSSEGAAEAAGSKDFDAGFIRHLEYQFKYLHTDIPSVSTSLKEGLGAGQFMAATKAFGSRNLILRFGALMEGGNKQTDVSPSQVPAGNLPASSYGSLKLFVGGTMRTGRHAVKGSYGLQLGSAGEGTQLDFVKQIVDAGANLRFLVTDHRPVTIDLNFTAGDIQTRRELPVAERFFGGNVERNFIEADDWIIRSNPVIRSFPQNQFVQTSAAGILGGDSFFSANITLAATIWGKPLVPSEILAEPDFPRLATLQFNAAESALRNEYLSSTPEFRQLAEQVLPLSGTLASVGRQLTQLESQNLGSDLTDQIRLCRADLDQVNETVAAIKGDLQDGTPKTADIRKLVVGFPSAGVSSYVSDLIDDLATLKDMPGVSNASDIAQSIVELGRQQDTSGAAFTALDKSPLAATAKKRAVEDMIYPRRVFDELTHEANLISVSPVFIFDAARMRQRGVLDSEVRYAVGGGMRLSIVSLDVTMGYAVNPNPRPWERRGAVLISMQVSNLFR